MAATKPKLSLVQQRTANSAAAAGGEDQDDEARFLADLRGLLWEKGGAVNGSWTTLAAKANLHRTTISKFAVGTTKKPMLFTIRRMIMAIDYVMTIEPRRRRK